VIRFMGTFMGTFMDTFMDTRTARRLRALALALPLAALACTDEPAAPVLPALGPGASAAAPAATARAARIDPELARVLAAYDGVATPRTNVLLITLDSVRADFLSCYGYRPPHAPAEKTTPHLDRLAAEGVLLEDYYTNTSWTLPSHLSLLTGQPSLVHSVDHERYALLWRRPTLAAILQRAGYATAGFYTGPFVHERFGFDRGFDRYESAYGKAAQAANDRRAELQDRIDRAIAAGDVATANELLEDVQRLDKEIDALAHGDRSAAVVTGKVLAAIAAAGARPWFLFAHYFDPHYDYDPPAEFARFDPDYRGAIDGRGFITSLKVRRPRKDVPSHAEALRPGAPPRTTERAIEGRDLEHIEALYAGEIAWTDAQIGRVLDALRESGALDRTLVIVTADHGEEFFEHGGVGHRHALTEELLRVPMLLRLPDALPSGARVRGVASHPDVLPTVLDLLRLPVPAEVQGKSFLPLLLGEDDGGEREMLGRLIYYQAPGTRGPRIESFTVREVFRVGSLKISRARHWRAPAPGCPPERAEAVRAEGEAERARDVVLSWIDLAQHPHERLEEHSSDFGDPRAAAALAAFQRTYERLLALPNECELCIGGGASWAVHTNANYRATAAQAVRQYVLTAPGK
jgi:arylsulfatase A-like enzyme